MDPRLPEVSNHAEWYSMYHTGSLSWRLSADAHLQNTVHFHHTGGKQSFTYLLDIREQQRDHSVCYLLCSSKSWHNGGSIKHKENSQLSWVAGRLWKDLDHRKKKIKSAVQTSGQVEMHIWIPTNYQNLRTPACKLQQVLLAQLKSSRLTAAPLTRLVVRIYWWGYCSCS